MIPEQKILPNCRTQSLQFDFIWADDAIIDAAATEFS
jgi:hypothetical protein